MMEKALFELLKPLVPAGRVYAMQAPQESSGANKYIVFQRIDSERPRAINNPTHLPRAYMQIDCYAETYYGAKELSAAVESALDGFHGTVYYGADSPQESVTIGGISLQNDIDLLDETDNPLLYRSSLTFLVKYQQ